MEPYIKETINIKEENIKEEMRYMKINIKEEMRYMKIEVKEKKARNLNIIEGTKLGNRELFRDLSKSALVDTTLKKSDKNDN